jgi:hypothetical protein
MLLPAAAAAVDAPSASCRMLLVMKPKAAMPGT